MILAVPCGTKAEDNLSIPSYNDLFTGSGKFIQFTSINPNLNGNTIHLQGNDMDNIFTNEPINDIADMLFLKE
jgi:hypothetical protein